MVLQQMQSSNSSSSTGSRSSRNLQLESPLQSLMMSAKRRQHLQAKQLPLLSRQPPRVLGHVLAGRLLLVLLLVGQPRALLLLLRPRLLLMRMIGRTTSSRQVMQAAPQMLLLMPPCHLPARAANGARQLGKAARQRLPPKAAAGAAAPAVSGLHLMVVGTAGVLPGPAARPLLLLQPSLPSS